MKRWLTVVAVILALAVPGLGVAQVLTVDPSVNQFQWTQPAGPADGSKDPATFTFNCGAIQKGGFPYVAGQSVYNILINQVVSAAGSYTCNVSGINAAGTSAASNNVSIVIQQLWQLAILKTGSGTVTSVPAGITCGATCNAGFVDTTSVTLTVAPSTGYIFTGWSGSCTGTALTCTLTMNSTKSAQANFLGVPLAPTLTVK